MLGGRPGQPSDRLRRPQRWPAGSLCGQIRHAEFRVKVGRQALGNASHSSICRSRSCATPTQRPVSLKLMKSMHSQTTCVSAQAAVMLCHPHGLGHEPFGRVAAAAIGHDGMAALGRAFSLRGRAAIHPQQGRPQRRTIARAGHHGRGGGRHCDTLDPCGSRGLGITAREAWPSAYHQSRRLFGPTRPRIGGRIRALRVRRRWRAFRGRTIRPERSPVPKSRPMTSVMSPSPVQPFSLRGGGSPSRPEHHLGEILVARRG